ncbi:MAG: Sir2 family NAD-dependent protein deacetylase [Sandaracinus sp.]
MAESLAALIRASRACVVLTGAGVSTASGIPDFRGDHGLWSREDAARVATIEGFRNDPRGFYAFWSRFFGGLAAARPNDAHRAIARLEDRGLVHTLITQNVDGLHSLAGSRDPLEVHGSFRRARCLQCGARYETARFLEELRPGEIPTCTICSGLVKPDVVLFGEPLDESFARAESAVGSCDLLVAIGTSLAVAPVADLVPRALDRGAKVAIVNRDPTPFDDEATLVLGGDLVEHARSLARELALPLVPLR